MTFKIGYVSITHTLVAKYNADLAEAYEMLERHEKADFGDISKDDKALNLEAIETKDQILSSYKSKLGFKVWIITDCGHKNTTILLPSDY